MQYVGGLLDHAPKTRNAVQNAYFQPCNAYRHAQPILHACLLPTCDLKPRISGIIDVPPEDVWRATAQIFW